MGFVIGLVAFAVITGLLFKHKSQPTWFGQRWAAGGDRAEFSITRGKSGLSEVRFGVPTVPGLKFTLRPERGYDRFAKWLTLSAEYQVGEDGFDRAVYIISDSDAVCRVLLGDARLREGLLALVREPRGWLRVTHVQASAGKLWVRMKPGLSSTDDDVFAAGIALAPDLQKVAMRMSGLLRSRPIDRDRTFVRAAAFAAISAGLAINGAVALAMFVFGSSTESATTLDRTELLIHAALLAAALIAALAVASRVLLGRSSRGHLVLMELLSFGLLGALATAWIELRQFNIEFDRAAPVAVSTDVIATRISKGTKSRRYQYYVTVNDWTRSGERAREFKVSDSLHRRVKPGSNLLLDEHAGSLGYRWVDNLRVPP